MDYEDNYGDYGRDLGNLRFPRPVTVTELNEFVKRIFDGIPQLTDIYVSGEISNFKNHYATGHLYFSLKDESSCVKAVMFRSSAMKLKFAPENGMKVTVHGRVAAFVRDGQYQLYADSMEPQGTGSLYLAYEQLKAKLASEGLFDEAHKKPLPKYPKTVGVITSATGAAVRDIINVLKRRYPLAKVLLYPALVQGAGASEDVANGIKYFNAKKNADVLIIGRGGGSIEDLWAFNSEMLARVIYDSEIPVISAVGHETDFTISDFVADKRAPTPSAAAELAVPDMGELKAKLEMINARQKNLVLSCIAIYKDRLNRLASSRVLKSPTAYLDEWNMVLLKLATDLENAEKRLIEKKKVVFAATSRALGNLDPLSVLSRGYGAVYSEDGGVVKSSDDINIGETITVKLQKGSIKAEVKEKAE